MTEFEIREIIRAITYKPGWSFLIGHDGDRLFVQASVSTLSDLTMDPTGKSLERTPWKSGKRHLSPHMCRQEIVGVVFGVIKDAEEHETREWFRYRGASIYNPHLDPDALVELARKRSSFNCRDNAMSMEEAPAPARPKPVSLVPIRPAGSRPDGAATSQCPQCKHHVPSGSYCKGLYCPLNPNGVAA